MVTILSTTLLFTNSFWQVVLIKFLVVPIGYGVYNCFCAVQLEIYGSPRTKPIFFCGVFLHIPFTTCICGLLVKYLITWKQVQIVVIVSYVIITILSLFVMETPTYLLAKGKTQLAEKQIKRIGRINRVTMNQLDFRLLATKSKFNLDQKVGFFDIWKQGKASTILNLAVFGTYFAAYIVYWGFSLNIGILPVSFEMGFYVTGIVGCIGASVRDHILKVLFQNNLFLGGPQVSVYQLLHEDTFPKHHCKYFCCWTTQANSTLFVNIITISKPSLNIRSHWTFPVSIR